MTFFAIISYLVSFDVCKVILAPIADLLDKFDQPLLSIAYFPPSGQFHPIIID